ncbi:MAG: sulfotransferase [Cyanophyceae cyanobacterium]
MVAQLSWLYVKTRPYKALSRLLSYALFEGRPVTTKGRWINPFLFALLNVEKTIPALKKVEKPIFIVGTGRSGSTLLGLILSLHPQIGFLNEPKALWHAIYPQEDLTGSYSQKNAYYSLTEAEINDEVRQTAHRLYSFYLSLTGSKRVLDKYPEMIFRVSFVKEIFPDAKLIFLVRNGWNTCQSIAKWSERFGKFENGATSDWWGVNDRKWKLLVEQLVNTHPDFRVIKEEVSKLDSHVDKGAVEWILTMQQGLEAMQETHHSIYQLRYEELTLDPARSLTEVLEFCQLPYDQKMINFACQTITPTGPSRPVPLNPILLPSFEATMHQLGY